MWTLEISYIILWNNNNNKKKKSFKNKYLLTEIAFVGLFLKKEKITWYLLMYPRSPTDQTHKILYNYVFLLLFFTFSSITK